MSDSELSATNNKEIAEELLLQYTQNDLIELVIDFREQSARISKLEDALRFYAEGTPTQIGCDRGKRARQALGGE